MLVSPEDDRPNSVLKGPLEAHCLKPSAAKIRGKPQTSWQGNIRTLLRQLAIDHETLKVLAITPYQK